MGADHAHPAAMAPHGETDVGELVFRAVALQGAQEALGKVEQLRRARRVEPVIPAQIRLRVRSRGQGSGHAP